MLSWHGHTAAAADLVSSGAQVHSSLYETLGQLLRGIHLSKESPFKQWLDGHILDQQRPDVLLTVLGSEVRPTLWVTSCKVYHFILPTTINRPPAATTCYVGHVLVKPLSLWAELLCGWIQTSNQVAAHRLVLVKPFFAAQEQRFEGQGHAGISSTTEGFAESSCFIAVSALCPASGTQQQAGSLAAQQMGWVQPCACNACQKLGYFLKLPGSMPA